MDFLKKMNAENVKGVMQLIRLPNVLIIVATQFLLRYCIVLPLIYRSEPSAMSPTGSFLVLIAVTVLIAIGGYVINDYFDVKIDSINRPEKQVVNKLITPRGAIKLHILLNVVAILLGFYLAWRVKAVSFGLLFPFLAGLLWIYSAKYKRMLFWGNFIVSALSAFVILIVWLFEFFNLRLDASLFSESIPAIHWVNYVFYGYALFAFLVSMAREIIKDMEDTEGDATFGCKTLPLVLGMKPARNIAAAIIVATIILMIYVQLILFRLVMMMAFWYLLVTVQAGAVYLLLRLFSAREKQDFHYLSTLCKLIMVAGILSMEIFLISL